MNRIIILLLVAVGYQLSAFAQGPLTPPGVPAPTMKTLQQVEPRTPISSLPATITVAGSYYLTTNLNAVTGNGIIISANNVTVDLNGFALTGNSAGVGVFTSAGQTNTSVRGGSISGWLYGVEVAGYNNLLERLVVSGCATYGVYAIGPAVAQDCIFANNGNLGIFIFGGGQIIDCDASNNGGNGIFCNYCTVRNCHAAGNAGHGIYIYPGTVVGCSVQNNGGSGIYIDLPGAEVIGNNCRNNNITSSASNAGIFANDSNNRIEDNHVSANGYAGISVGASYTGNIVIKNSVSGNGANNYLTPGNQVVGPLITTFGTISSSNPWANFSF